MTKQEVINILTDKKGYIKKSPSFIAVKFDCSIDEATEALQEVKQLNKTTTSFIAQDTPPVFGGAGLNQPQGDQEDTFYIPSIPDGMEISKMWTKADGKMGYSFKTTLSPEDEGKVDKDTIQSILTDVFSDTNIVKIEDKETGKAIINVYLSDEHLGCDTGNGLYENKFGPEVLRKRHGDVISELSKLSQLYGRFAQINLINLGDAIDGMDGQTTRGGHNLEQNMTNREVFTEFLKIHKSTIDTIVDMDITDTMSYIAIANSNHGGDMEYMAFAALEQYVNLKYPDMLFAMQEKFFNPMVIGQHIFLFTHGKDDTYRSRGLPLHLDKNAETFIRDYIDETLGDNVLYKNIHVVKGDLHQSASEYTKRFRYKNCPSMMGSSAWIMANFGNTKPATDYDVLIGDTVLEGHIRH